MYRLFLIFSILLLVMLAWEDYKRMEVGIIPVAALFLSSMLYVLFGGNDIGIAGFSILLFACIFSLPCLFYMGAGDWFIFISLGAFMPSEEYLWLFLSIFLIIWAIHTLKTIIKKPGLLFSKKEFLYHETPLVPVILFSFLIWGLILVIVVGEIKI